MNRRETERILEAIRSVQASGGRAALATVVRVRGSAYRREGARILVREDGSYECLLSGGCLEPAVAEAADRVIKTGTAGVRQYDLDEDSVWSLGIGCSGAVDILIERIEDDPLTRAWLDVLGRAESAVLVKSLSDPPARMLVRECGVQGSLGSAALDERAAALARGRLRAVFPVSGPECVEKSDLFFEVSAPPPWLVVFGAGSDAEPLARQAWELGFAVTIVDPRESFLTAERFPHATLVAAQPDRFTHDVRLAADAFVVIMNHHLERDRECLRFALSSPAPYIGLLGPRSRYHRLLAGLCAAGMELEPASLARVRSPVGLALGAETPEEIALSILGEILAVQRGFDGGFLTGRETSLHRSAESTALAAS
jgi:xanthine/CO dehydrogenase XdhC/CoxF family maturation factor